MVVGSLGSSLITHYFKGSCLLGCSVSLGLQLMLPRGGWYMHAARCTSEQGLSLLETEPGARVAEGALSNNMVIIILLFEYYT